MSKRRLIFFSLFAVVLLAMAGIQTNSQYSSQNTNEVTDLIAGRNVNMVSGSAYPEGDPYLQRQNEPSIAVSTRNPLHLLAGANDYRSLNIAFEDTVPGLNIQSTTEYRDAWLGVFKSFDGGQSWTSTLMPGYPQDTTQEGLDSPIKGLHAAADPTVRAGPNGLFFYSGLAFDRIEKGKSKIFVARFIDNNNKETGDPIKYLDTTILDTGTSGQFTDKPWIAVDIPRDGSSSIDIDGQIIPSGNVYIVYSIFLGNIERNEIHSKILFARSTDYGETWEHPIKLSESQHINQGTTLAIAPDDGTIYVAWRRFGSEGEPDAILACHSKNGGRKFSKTVEVATINAFDQPTSQITFRSNCYPSMTVDDSGYIYLAWSQRTYPAPGEWSRIIMSTSNNGVNWSEPTPVVDEGVSGHQFMPALTFAGGKLTMLWYDQRFDICENFDYYIDEVYEIRHTIDVRSAQANPSLIPVFLDSIQVSRYPLYLVTNNLGEPIGVQQLKYNMPNLPIFQHGTVPFMGDYIDIAPSPYFVPDGDGWAFNTNEKTVYYAAWTDNRDVIPPGLGDDYEKWYEYSAPGPGCNSGEVGVRNQNIYTSRLSSGIIAGSPGNTKPLNTDRAFVVFVKNSTGTERYLTLEIDAPAGITAYFMKSGANEGNSLSVTVLPYSSISTTVMVEQSENLDATVKVNVLDESGNLLTYILLNPDSTNPFLEHPDVDYPTPHVGSGDFHTPHVGSSFDGFWDYSVANPHVGSSEWMEEFVTPHVGSEDYFNNDWVTPHVGSSDSDDGNFVRSDITNPHVGSEGFPFSFPEESTLQDYMLDVENKGNTTSSYSLDTFPAGVQEGIVVQMIVYKIYTTPNAIGCDLKNQEHHQLILNVHNIDYQSGSTSSNNRNLSVSNLNTFSDYSFFLAPGERCRIIYRIYNPAGNYESNILSSTNENSDPYLSPNSLVPKIDADAPDSDGSTASALVIKPTPLPPWLAGQYNIAFIQAYGGYDELTGRVRKWSLVEAPSWLDINENTGEISGSPNSGGTYTFTVQVEDTLSDRLPLSATRELSITIYYKITASAGPLGSVSPSGEVLVEDGTDQTFTITPNTYYQVSEVVVDGTPIGGQTSYTFYNVKDNHTIEATFTIMTYTLAINTAGTGSGSVLADPSQELYDHGSAVTLTANPADNSDFVEWSGDLTGTTNPATITMDGDKNVTAIFNLKKYALTINTAGTGSGAVAETVGGTPSQGHYDHGTTVTLTANPADGSDFVEWSGDLTDSANPATITMLGDKTITATFKLKQYTLTIDTAGTGSGSVLADPSQELYDHGSAVTLTANPADNSDFVEWSGDLTGTTNPATITMDGEKNITATFNIKQYTLTIDTAGTGSGSVLADPSQGPYDHGTTVTLTATPDIGSLFVGWSGNVPEGMENANPLMITMDDDKTITASFIVELKITTTSLDLNKGFLGSPYSATLEATGGLEPYKWSLVEAPGWLNINISTGEISGTPLYDSNVNYPYPYSFTVKVVDSFNIIQTATQELQITIDPKKVEKLIGYQGPGDDEATAVTTDSQGNIYVTGYKSGSGTGLDYYTIKYFSSGEKDWEAPYEGPDDDKPAAITVDSTGVYVTGYSTGGTTGPDYFTVKYDSSNGNVLWEARYDGPSHLGDYATAIDVDSSGNVYVTGHSYRGKQTKHSDYCTVKYDSNGNLIWDKRYDSRRNGNDVATTIAVDSVGNIYVTGRSQDSQAKGDDLNYDYYTIKYNSSGRALWEERYDGPVSGDDEATAIALDSSGVYVTGRSMGSGYNFDYYTVKYDIDNRSTLWDVRYDAGDSDEASAIVLDSLGVYVTGRSMVSDNNFDYYTVKYNINSGGKDWDITYDGGGADEATGIAVDSEGNVCVTGFSTGTPTNADCFTIKYNDSGSVAWVARYNGSADLDDYGIAISVDISSGNVYVVGYSTETGTNKDYLILKY